MIDIKISINEKLLFIYCKPSNRVLARDFAKQNIIFLCYLLFYYIINIFIIFNCGYAMV